MNEEVIVSVFCLAYNHEKYIRKTLEGFVTQKADFKFEILIHDDASTDGTKNIIEEYTLKYPELIKPIYQKENQYCKRIGIHKTFNLPRAKGKYIAFCEGDDYWCDCNKLQKMVDALEANPGCSAVFNKVRVITEDGKNTDNFFPKYQKLRTGIIDSKTFLGLIAYTRTLYYLQFQLSGFMLKTECYKEYMENLPPYKKLADVGDIPLFLFVGLRGDVYYIDEEMSHYRANSIGNWNSRFNSGKEKKVAHLRKECKMLESFDEYSNYIIHDEVQKGIKNREFGIYRVELNLKGMKSPEMREFYLMLSFKERLKYHLQYYFPRIYSIREAIKGRKNG